jgi:hypothetical protein
MTQARASWNTRISDGRGTPPLPAHGGSVYSLIRMCMSKSDFVFNTRPLHDHTIFDLTNGSTEISSSIRVLLEYGDLCPGSSRAPPRLMAAAQSDSRFRMEKSCRQVSGAIIPRQRGGMKLPTLPYYAGAMVRAKKQPEYDGSYYG